MTEGAAAEGRGVPGPGVARRLAYAVLFGTHAGPWLLPRAPRTLARVARVLAGADAPRGGLHAFGERDAGFRGWYRKIAADQRAGGRAGYAWDDGLGLPMNPRFYNNAGTYLPYGALGPRAYAALSMALFLGVVAGAYALAGAPAMGAAAAVLLLASPLFLGAQLHLGKPEILWWALLTPLALAAWQGHWLAAGLLFTAVALVNFAVAFLAGVTCLLLLALSWPGPGGAGMLVLGMTPGLLKTALRLVPFVRSGMLGSLVGEQSSAAGPAAGPAGRLLAYVRSGTFVLYAGPYLAALALLVWGGELGAAQAVLGVAALAVFAAGQSILYLNDPQSFWMWHLALLGAMGALRPSWAGVAGLVLLAYVHPRVLGLPLPEAGPAGGGLGARAAAAARQLAAFPGLAPLGREAWAAPLRPLLDALAPGTRLLMETDAGDRELGGYRTWMLLCDEELPPAGVELVPDEYVRAYHPRLFTEVLARVRAGTPPEQLRAAAELVGAGAVLAYTPALAAALEGAGFVRAGGLDPAALPDRARRLLRLPPAPLVLLRAPGAGQGVISPPVPVRREGNALHWEARGGTSYLVRYAWHPRMRAEQGGRPLEVAAEPQAGGAVTFMRVRARADGPLALRFHPRWLA